jgi:hypothetical protein
MLSAQHPKTDRHTTHTGQNIMNKSETKEMNKIVAIAPHLGADFAARAVSALIRCSMRSKAQAEMLAIARQHGWDKSSEFIICPRFA